MVWGWGRAEAPGRYNGGRGMVGVQNRALELPHCLAAKGLEWGLEHSQSRYLQLQISKLPTSNRRPRSWEAAYLSTLQEAGAEHAAAGVEGGCEPYGAGAGGGWRVAGGGWRVAGVL